MSEVRLLRRGNETEKDVSCEGNGSVYSWRERDEHVGET